MAAEFSKRLQEHLDHLLVVQEEHQKKMLQHLKQRLAALYNTDDMAAYYSKVINEPDRHDGIAEPTGAPPIQREDPTKLVNVHGQCVDQPSKTTRSVDQSFAHGPLVARPSSAQITPLPNGRIRFVYVDDIIVYGAKTVPGNRNRVRTNDSGERGLR